MTKLQQAAQKIVIIGNNVEEFELRRLRIESELRKIEDAAYIKGYKACLKKQEMAREVDKAIYDPVKV